MDTSDNDFMVNEPAARYYKASEGLTKADFLAVVSMTGLSLSEFSALLPASKRTIEKVKDKELLNPQVSDRVMQLAGLYNFGGSVLGDLTSFKEWLQTPLLALGGKKPIEFLNKETGISFIHDTLGRIAHGVFS